MSEHTPPLNVAPARAMVLQEAGEFQANTTATSPRENQLIQALRTGDETAFVSLLEQYDASLLRMALIYVPNLAVAQEVVQETWLAVLRGLNQFEGRSSLKTWIFRILIHCAQKRGQRESRSIAFSALAVFEVDSAVSEEEEEQFLPDTHPQQPGHWASFPRSWEHVPEERLLSQETLLYLRQALDGLPRRQREVIVLRDIEGWTSDEVCHFLEVSETHQRVLLHRARSYVRRVLAEYLQEE